MVRFIMFNISSFSLVSISFTFQYGQIYYPSFAKPPAPFYEIYIPIWLDLLLNVRLHLLKNLQKFTFQYGQIYYHTNSAPVIGCIPIYIPIWLDLLYNIGYGKVKSWTDLHSNMVRFIMLADYRAWANATEFTFQYGQIYYKY